MNPPLKPSNTTTTSPATERAPLQVPSDDVSLANGRSDVRAERSVPGIARHGGHLTAAALLAADLAGLVSAAAVAVATLWMVGVPVVPSELALVAALGVLATVAFRAANLYPGAGVDRAEEVRRMTLLVLGLLASFAVGTLVSAPDGRPFAHLFPTLLTGLLFLVLAPALRAAARHAFARRPWWGVPVVVLGGGPDAVRLVAALLSTPDVGLRPIACFDDATEPGHTIHGVPVVGPLAEAAAYRAAGVRHAVVAKPSSGTLGLEELLGAYARDFPSVLVVPDAAELARIGGATALSLGDAVGLHVRQALLLPRNRLAKRLLDIALVVPAGLVAAPIVALCALWIAATNPGNPFYFQSREGLGGRPIKVWKLRTMHLDAEALLERYLNENPAARTEWETRYKLADDPRILPGVGSFLRRTSLDELPQLWNIALGEMSFVGPRPFPNYHLAAFGDRFRVLRHSVPPGLTGLWQVSGRGEGDVAAQEALDTHYIRRWSIWLDLYILARTPLVVVLGKGAH